MRILSLSTLLGLAACGGDATDTTGGTGDTATPDTDTTAACEALAEGPWSMSGSCFGMPMSATVTLEADGCTFTFSAWNMQMSVPEGGSVTGTDVTLSGAGWDDCTGTTDGGSISGECDGGSCTYDMSADQR
jgi:hypothetical protein